MPHVKYIGEGDFKVHSTKGTIRLKSGKSCEVSNKEHKRLTNHFGNRFCTVSKPKPWYLHERVLVVGGAILGSLGTLLVQLLIG